MDTLIRHKPRLTYCGLTIILSNRSRFDKVSLLSANGGCFFNEECLGATTNIWQCDVRLKEDRSELLAGTKCVLLLGESSAQLWLNNKENTLNEIRGSVYLINDIPHIASYFPQDAKDVKDYESTLNDNIDRDSIDDRLEENESNVGEKRRHGRTRRKNYSFWLKKDTEKALRLCKQYNGIVPKRLFEPEYIIYPPSQLVIEVLTNTKNERLFFDIETDENLAIQCFSFCFGINQPIYCVPVISHNYEWSYSELPRIFKALCISFRNNILVAHNGSNFDYFVLGYKYHIPIGKKVEDTMLMQHRCYPEVEKSLGHCTSLWTWEPFHKDEGNTGYNNTEQVHKKLQYCGKDVFTMVLIHDALLKHAKRNPGLEESFAAVNESIRPYLIITFTGLEYEQQSIEDIWKENDRLMTVYLKVINLLIGDKTKKQLSQRFKSALPSSNPQCVEYFHNLLGYPVVGKGKPRKDGSRGPSLSKKNIYKLRLKFNNPVIDFIIAYRELAKESGSLKFTPWKTDEPINNNT